jgi:hypothetical protein
MDGNPIFGWMLREDIFNETGTMSGTSFDKALPNSACWEPFHNHMDNSPCVLHRYNNWIDYVGEVERKQRHLPIFDEHSSGKKKHFDFNIIREQMDQYQPKCQQGNDELVDYHNNASTSPVFCHFRTYDGRNSNSREVDASQLEWSNHLEPSEVVRMLDRDQLGIVELSDALTFMNETFAHLNVSSCTTEGQSEQLLLCVFRRHSMPSANKASKVTIKGWLYRTMDQCYIPINDMEYSFTCGRSSVTFNVWSRYMTDRQQGNRLP